MLDLSQLVSFLFLYILNFVHPFVFSSFLLFPLCTTFFYARSGFFYFFALFIMVLAISTVFLSAKLGSLTLLLLFFLPFVLLGSRIGVFVSLAVRGFGIKGGVSLSF